MSALGLHAASTSGRLATVRPCRRARCAVMPAAISQVQEPAQGPIIKSHDDTPAPSTTWAPIMAMAGAASFLSVLPAWAADDEVIVESTEAAQSASGVLAAVAQEQSSYDFVVSIIFTGVIAMLTIVTLGVAYLSLGQFFDSRQETADKEAALKPPKAGSTDKADKDKESDELMALSLKKSFQAKRDKTKGFGSNVTTTPKEF